MYLSHADLTQTSWGPGHPNSVAPDPAYNLLRCMLNMAGGRASKGGQGWESRSHRIYDLPVLDNSMTVKLCLVCVLSLTPSPEHSRGQEEEEVQGQE